MIKMRPSLLALVVITLCAMGFMVSYSFWRFDDVPIRPVHVIHEARVLSPVVKKGGPLVVENIVSRTVACSVYVHRFIISATDNVIVWSSVVPGVDVMGDRVVVRRSFLFPTQLPAGQYFYKSEVHSIQCQGIGDKRNIPPSVTPLLPFTVVEDASLTTDLGSLVIETSLSSGR